MTSFMVLIVKKISKKLDIAVLNSPARERISRYRVSYLGDEG